MSPDVIRAKLALLQQVLNDLSPHVQSTRDEQKENHYEIERQVQLAVDNCLAIGRRLLIIKSIPIPETNRELFIILGKHKLISTKLAKALGDAVGLRNLLVYGYGSIDYSLFFSGLPKGYEAFLEYVEQIASFLKK